MNYYFTASTKQLQKDLRRYKLIINYLNALGCRPLNYVHFPKNSSKKVKYEKMVLANKISVFKLQTSLIDQADMLIADITKESITVGYQIDYAIKKKIPILILTDKDTKLAIPVVLTDDHFGLLTIEKYKTDKDIKNILKKFTQSFFSKKIKFNLFLNISIHNYIAKRAIKERKAKSQVVREIILKEMGKNPV